jgi:prevent-host-death family protein
MSTTTLSSREFNQHSSEAKRAADSGPVYITDRGRPTHVLLNVKEYRRLTGSARSIVDLLSMDTDLSFDPPRSREVANGADFD